MWQRAKDETPEDLDKIDSSVTYRFCDLWATHFTSLSPSFFIYKIALSSQSALHYNQLDMLQPDSQQGIAASAWKGLTLDFSAYNLGLVNF